MSRVEEWGSTLGLTLLWGKYVLYLKSDVRIKIRKILREHYYVLSESFMHLPLRLIFRQSHPNFINVRTAYASKIGVQLTKNLLAKSGTERFRENITGGNQYA